MSGKALPINISLDSQYSRMAYYASVICFVQVHVFPVYQLKADAVGFTLEFAFTQIRKHE